MLLLLLLLEAPREGEAEGRGGQEEEEAGKAYLGVDFASGAGRWWWWPDWGQCLEEGLVGADIGGCGGGEGSP